MELVSWLRPPRSWHRLPLSEIVCFRSAPQGPMQTKRLALHSPRRRTLAMAMGSPGLDLPSISEPQPRIGMEACPLPSPSSSSSLSSSISTSVSEQVTTLPSVVDAEELTARKRRLDKAMRRKAARSVYFWAAIASSVGFTALAGSAVYYRFVWQMQGTDEVPYVEVLGTFALAVGAAVGMEYWARWAHKALWHASLWHMHESHHRPREGPFELNDVFAIINAAPAIALMAYGFFNVGFMPGLCFGAGLGITMFGMAYMFVHDGLVHRRFPVGPIADVPYLQKVAAAHKLHHADLFGGVPYGLFLGPKELERVGGSHELEALLRTKRKGSAK